MKLFQLYPKALAHLTCKSPNRAPLLRKPYRDIPKTTPVRLLFDLAYTNQANSISRHSAKVVEDLVY